MAADVTKSVRISFNLNANFSKALDNINNAFKTIQTSAATVNTSLTPIATAINKIKPPADFDKFVGGLRSLASIKADNVTRIQTALDNVAKVKFPDFSAMNPKIEAHANAVNKLGDAYKKLGEGMRAVDMRRLSNAVASGNAAINNQGQIISRNRTAFAQYAYAIGSASSGLSVLGSRLYGITRGFSAISRELSASLGIFVSVFGAMFAIKGVVKDLVAFDDAMRRTAAVANASSSELQLMTDAARQMGETTRYTAQQAAEGLQMLALAGLNATEAIKALPTVLNAAASEGIELDKAASVLLSTLNAYGMGVESLTDVSDILVATSVNSATSLLQLKESMKQVAPIAASAGIDLAQLSALLGTLADAGFTGSKSGTVLKNAITRLLSPTKMVREALANYNLTADELIKNNTDAATGQLNFIAVLEQMRSKSIETGDAMRIFGLIAGSGMVKLLQSSNKSIRQLYETLQNAEGTSLKVAYEMEAGVGGSLRRLKSMWEELSLSIGDAINDDLVNFFENLTRVIRENKDTLVAYMSTIMKAIGIVIEMTLSIAELIVSFPELSIAIFGVIAALTTFFGVLKTAQIIGLTQAMSSLISLNFVGLAASFANGAANIALFNAAIKGFSVSSILLGFKALISNFGIFALEIGAATVALAPYIAGIGLAVGAIYGLIKIYQTLFPNYKKIADESFAAAKATDEFTKTLEYQRAELGLITKQYKTNIEYGVSVASLEERLSTLLQDANIPMSERIRLLDEWKNKQKPVNDVMAELNNLLEQASIDNLSIALKEQANGMATQYTSLKKLNNEMAVMSKQRNDFKNKDAWGNVLVTDQEWLEQQKNIAKTNQEFKKSSDVMINQYIPAFIKAGGSIEQFKQALSNTSLKGYENEIILLVNEYKKLQDAADAGVDIGKGIDPNNVAKQSLDIIRQLNGEYAEQAKQIDAVLKEELSALKLKQQELGTGEEQALKEQVALNQKYSLKKLQIADDYFKQIKVKYDALAPEYKTAESEQTKEVEAASKAKSEAFQEYVNNITEGLSDLRKKYKEYSDGVKKSEDEIAKARADAVKKAEDAARDYNQNIRKLDEDTTKKVSELQSKSSQNVLSIQESAEDKIRSIRQDSMSDYQKELSNTTAANDKFYRGQQAITQATATGNQELLDYGKDLIQQSQSLYEGLKNRASGVYGIQKATDELVRAEQAATQLKTQALKTEQDNEIRTFRETYKTKITEAYNAAKEIITAQNLEITNYKLKLDLIQKEIQLLIAKKQIEALDVNSDDYKRQIGNLLLLENQVKKVGEAIDQISIDSKLNEQAENIKIEEKFKSLEKQALSNITNFEKLGQAIDTNIGTKGEQAAIKATKELEKMPDKFAYKVELDNGDLVEYRGTIAEINDDLHELSKEHKYKIVSITDTKSIDALGAKVNEITQQAIISITLNDGSIKEFTSKLNEIDNTIAKIKKDIGEENIVTIKTHIETNIEELQNQIPKEIPIEIKANTENFQKQIEGASILLEKNLGKINTETSEGNIKALSGIIQGVDEDIADISKKPIDVKTDTTQLDNLQLQLDAMKEKLIQVLAKVQGRTDIEQLKALIDSLTDKVINIKYKITTEGKTPDASGKALGGYIDGYANGGNVYKRLTSPFISKGSGNRDDVPAMLMKGEFVQKVSAVRKYGRDFMSKLNAGAIPKYITQMFANGGFVSNLGLNLRNNHGIDNMLGLMKSSLYTPIPAYASGGLVNNPDSYNARIELALGNKTYTVKAQTNVAKELVKEMKRYGRALA